MPRETPWDLCRRMAEETLQRIRRDRLKASVRVVRLLDKLEEKLFDSDLQVEDLRRASGQLDPNLSTLFATELGLPPSKYFLQARMEIAGRMLTAGDHKVREIALEVGYLRPDSFSRAFRKWSGKSPTPFRQEPPAEAAAAAPPPPAEPLGRDELRRGLDRLLPAAQGTALLNHMGGLQDAVRGHYQAPVPPVPREQWVEPVMAERLWRWIEVLPPEEQRAAIESQSGSFRTPALFHRLCTESIEAGRDDDVRGMGIASLALAAMTTIVERLGRQPMTLTLFARAHAVVGLAFLRSGHPEAAAESFEVARRILGLAGKDAHPVVMMELCLYQAMLHLDRDETRGAAMLIDIGLKIYRTLLAKVKQQAGEVADGPAAAG